jgi:hypothetical protein
MYEFVLVSLAYFAGVLTGAAIMVASVSFILEERSDHDGS